MINSILVKIFTDGDSAMFHPQTGERLISDCESYYFYVSNPVAFIDNLLSNNFKMSQHFYSVLLSYIETEDAAELLVLKPSYHDFGNYSIDIVKNINIL